MANTIFWSWQSDQPGRETRGLIRDALMTAIDRISADLEEADRPEIDHDTRGVAGTPDIVATILEKIEAASVFVADVTPITVSENGKHIANPNVLIELGYAKRALGTPRIVMVWNTALTNARPEDLPFDMRHRRAPIPYALAAGADAADLKRTRAQLTDRLEEALRASLATLPAAETASPLWHAADEHDSSIWENGSEPLVVNRGFDGSARIGMGSLPRGFARLIPAHWNPAPDALTKFEGGLHPAPLGNCSGMNYGPARGGFLVYRASKSVEENKITPSATRWFQATGELWGVGSCFFTEHEGKTYFSSGYAVTRWFSWVSHSVRVCEAAGGSGPYHLILGVAGCDESFWPGDRYNHTPDAEALESSVTHSCMLADGSEETIKAAVKAVYDASRRAYGWQDSTPEMFEAVLRGR